MADPHATLSKLDRRFPIAAISLFGVMLGLSTLFENDKRGLLRWERPSAFAAAKVSDLPGPGAYTITYLGNGERANRSRTIGPARPRRVASRSIPLASEPLTGPGAGASASASPLSTSPAQLAGASVALTPTGSTPVTSGGPPSFTPGNLIGVAPPFGLVAFVPDNGVTPVDPTIPVNPVVPAVPEPAAWLLMILGIGGLAAALRAKARRPADRVTNALA